jgi:hypothetical protein
MQLEESYLRGYAMLADSVKMRLIASHVSLRVLYILTPLLFFYMPCLTLFPFDCSGQVLLSAADLRCPFLSYHGRFVLKFEVNYLTFRYS